MGDAGCVLIHPWDAGADAEWRAFVGGRTFGLVIAAGVGRDVPVVTPAPYLLDGDTVLFHLARPNPIWKPLAENPRAMFVVTGDDTFIPSSWKATDDEDPTRGVPTWYYSSVQLTGDVTVVDDDETKVALLRRQLAAYEPGSGAADPSAHDRLLPGIRAARLDVRDVAAKFKYGGNVDEPHRRAVAELLAERNVGNDDAARAHLLRRLEAD